MSAEKPQKQPESAQAAKQPSSAAQAKAAAKAAKAQRRAAAKGLEPGERQQQQGQSAQSAPNNNSSSKSASASTSQNQTPLASSSTGPGSSGGPSTAIQPGNTVASQASSRVQLLAPRGPSVQTSASQLSSHDLINTIHADVSSIENRAQLLSASLSRSLHPSVILLQQRLASHTMLGSSARAIATLAALRDFVTDYSTPRGAVLNRDLVAKLGHQISAITSARPLGTSAGNAVRYLKYEISLVPAEMGEYEAKRHLVSRIDHFIRDRIIFASRVISTHVAAKIKDSGEDVLLTFARSSVVEQSIVDAWHTSKKRFQVICVGGDVFQEGQRLVESLIRQGIPTSYIRLSSLSSVLPRVTMVLLGTASLLANGSLYSRSGTATVAMMAHHRKIPVIVCCETYKFSERVRLEGVGGNENAIQSDNIDDGGSEDFTDTAPPNLSTLSLMYDLTPSSYISAVASEVGLSGPESVAILLRDYKSILFGS